MIACCGIDCEPCDIRQCPSDPELAERTAVWFRAHVDERAVSSWFRCSGCHGDRSDHWSADCWILRCCVDERGLRHCSECDESPCGRLVEWAGQNDRYGAALDRLRTMHAGEPRRPDDR